MSKDKGIMLSKEHGVNPSMMVCFWCGEEKGIALLGKLKGDAEAPRKAVYDYDPCEKCLEKQKQGVMLVEVTLIECDRPPIGGDDKGQPVFPTGKWSVLDVDCLKVELGAKKGQAFLLGVEDYEELIKGGSKT